MKVKVLNRFIDKETEVLYEPETVIDVTESRLKEIQAAGHFVEVVKSTKTKKKAEQERAVNPDDYFC